MKRWIWNFAAVVSLALAIAVCALWVIGQSGAKVLAWTYDRWLPDKSAASNQVYLTSNHRLWFDVNWGRVGPYNGQNVWGYYMNADTSGGKPQFHLYYEPYDGFTKWTFANATDPDRGASGFGPVRWYNVTRVAAKDGDDFRGISIGISHWLAALLLFVPPMIWLSQFCAARGFCEPICGHAGSFRHALLMAGGRKL